MSLDEETVARIGALYTSSTEPWFLGFSGGKDSSAVVKLVFSALTQAKKLVKPVTIVYCDTGVEIPILRLVVEATLKGLKREAKEHNVPLIVKRATPPLADSFFVKVIGRGYPPPTNKFRWCTDRLRINPIQRILQDSNVKRSIVLLGVRQGESAERDRTIRRHTVSGTQFLYQKGHSNARIFSPILNYSTEDVWQTLATGDLPKSIDANKLAAIYRGILGECPLIRSPAAPPCGAGRFGCWTCTVVRKDQGTQNLINIGGYQELTPLLKFRDWLASMRDIPENRCQTRRNGADGLGPLTLTARRLILERLLRVQKLSPWQLIKDEEIRLIKALWHEDATSPRYVE